MCDLNWCPVCDQAISCESVSLYSINKTITIVVWAEIYRNHQIGLFILLNQLFFKRCC